MSRDITVHARERGQRSNLQFFAGEGLLFSMLGRPADATVILTLGPDTEADPAYEESGFDTLAISAEDLRLMPEGETWHYNLWLQTESGRELMRFGTLSSRRSLAPRGATPPPPPLVIAGTPASTATEGSAYEFRPVVSGGVAPFVFSLSGTLPAGLSFSTADGAILGVPVAAGLASGLEITVTDSVGQTRSLPAFSIDVVAQVVTPALVITGTPSSTATTGEIYAFAPEVTGGTEPYVFALGGTLPAGLTFSTATGSIDGTSLAGGTFGPLVLTVSDARGQSAQLPAFSIVVSAAIAPLVLSGAPPASARVNEPYAFEPVATGGTASYSYALTGTLPDGLVFSGASGRIDGAPVSAGLFDGITITVTDSGGQSASTGPFAIDVAAAASDGIAFVWRWGQSNEGTLGNNPGQTAAQYRGAFPQILQADKIGSGLGPDEVYRLVPYAILDADDAPVVIGDDTISGPVGETTIIGDNIPVGPTFGLANEIRDNGLFSAASRTWFWKAASAGKALSFFVPRGDEADYAAADNDIWDGWRHKCYANRELRLALAAAGEPVYAQAFGDWQGEADVVNAAGDVASPYITRYAEAHARVYQSDAEVLGVEPPYFKIALRRVAGSHSATTDAMNARMAAMCRYRVDLTGAITDTGSGAPRMYFVDHGFEGLSSGSDNPHVSADEQRRIGLAIATALREIHGGDGFTTAYPITAVRPQLSGVTAALSNDVLTVSGYYSDPGVVSVTCRDATGTVVGQAQVTITDQLAGQSAFGVTISGLPSESEITWEAVLTLATGEASAPRTGQVRTAGITRRWDETFNTSDFTYGTTNVSGDTVTRLATIGARYPRAIPASGAGRIYFEISSPGGLIFAGIGTPGSPQNGGTIGVMRSGILNSNIRHSDGMTNASVNLGTPQVIRVAVDLDTAQMWIRSADMAGWNNDVAADPATAAGGVSVAGMDMTAIVPMVGMPSEALDVTAVLLATSDTWVHAAPTGFGPIG